MEDFPHFRAFVGSYYPAFEMLYDIDREGYRSWRRRMHLRRAHYIEEDCSPPRHRTERPPAAINIRLPDGSPIRPEQVVAVTPLESALPGTRFANLFPDRVRIKMRDGTIHILRCADSTEARSVAAQLTERVLACHASGRE